MSADDQAFLDTAICLTDAPVIQLSSVIPSDIKRYSGDVAEFVEKNLDKASDILRESLSSYTWIPDVIRPRPRPPAPILVVPTSAWERMQSWVDRHKFLTGVVVVAAGTIAYRSYKSSKFGRKTRRAKRARSGGRQEVVVIAGSPTLPLTRSLSLDLERKGFIVFIVSSSAEDEVMVQHLARPDIRPLSLDITDPPNAGSSLERFAQYLQAPHSAVPRAKAHFLEFKGVILIPSLSYQTSPIATIPPSSFADLFNTHLLHPILTIQAFLPLLTTRLSAAGDKASPRVLVFTPSIISSINPPFHAPEATVCSALSAFTEVLTAELRPLAIPVTHIQLGTFDFTGFTPATSTRREQGLLTGADGSEPLQWPESARQVYGRNFVSQSSSAISAGRIRGMRGSSLRDLHNAVFDVIDGSNKSDVVRIGLGASVYGFVGRWVPRGLVAWMMGIRKVDELSTWQSSLASSPKSTGSDCGSGSQDFVAVPLEHVGDAHVWKEG